MKIPTPKSAGPNQLFDVFFEVVFPVVCDADVASAAGFFDAPRAAAFDFAMVSSLSPGCIRESPESSRAAAETARPLSRRTPPSVF
jgi:hypothetical protein